MLFRLKIILIKCDFNKQLEYTINGFFMVSNFGMKRQSNLNVESMFIYSAKSFALYSILSFITNTKSLFNNLNVSSFQKTLIPDIVYKEAQWK